MGGLGIAERMICGAVVLVLILIAFVVIVTLLARKDGSPW